MCEADDLVNTVALEIIKSAELRETLAGQVTAVTCPSELRMNKLVPLNLRKTS